MKKALIIFSIFAALSVLVSSTLFLTQPATLSQAFQLQVATLLFHMAGAILFLTAIKGFRQTLRSAYQFMSGGAAMLLFGVILIYSLTILGINQHPVVVTFGIIEFPFVLMAVFFYVGIRTFAKLVWTKSWLVNSKAVFATAGIVAIFAGVAPWFKILGSVFDPIVAIGVFDWLLFGASAILATKIYFFTSPFYKKAFGWLATFFMLTVFNAAAGFLYAIGWINWYVEVSTVTYLLAGLILSITALQFNRVAYAEKSKGNLPDDDTSHASTRNSVDLIVFVAGLASNPEAIATILDPLRIITASLSKKQPNEKEQAALADIYLKLENYLITKEPLRSFNQKDLRQMIELQFKDSVNEPAFWSKIPLDTSHS